MSDQETLHSFIEQHSFATLVSTGQEGPLISHIPLLLERTSGERGRLIGHLAKANSHWQSLEAGVATAVFHGPHAYISPQHYETNDAVPTWNYVVVHASGRPKINEDRATKLEVVRRFVTTYESSQDVPWQLASADPQLIDQLLDAIVVFEMPIDRLDGKWKLSQNHTPQRRARVVAALEAEGNPIADWMRELDRSS